MDLDLSGINKSIFTSLFIPNPLQSGQYPKGALKENSLGSREGIENPHSGQQCLLESNLSPFEERIRI